MSDGKLDPRAIAKRVAAQKQLVVPPTVKRPKGAANPEQLPDLDEAAKMLIPDIAGTADGWRAWGVKSELPADGIPLLHSVSHGSYVWPPREVQTATCNRGGRMYGGGHGIAHTPPGEHCSCGNYSAKTLEHLQSMSYHFYDAEAMGLYHVIGEVANWGKVVEGTQGWRAQHSYPRTLYVPFEAFHLALPLQAAYGVPVKLKNYLGYTFEKGAEEPE